MEYIGRLVLVAYVLGAVTCMNTWEVSSGNLQDHVTPELEQDWFLYKKSFNKTYASATEELTRRVYWEDNVRFIRDHNIKYEAGESTFTVGENHMADMADDEIKKMYLSGLIVPEEEPDAPWYPEEPLQEPFDGPPEKDWRKAGFVTPVKNQGACGSCWAFSAAAALEGLTKNKTDILEDLSEQNLLDCDRKSHGCRGGWMYWAFDYVKTNGGVSRDCCYPYKTKQGSCQDKSCCNGATCSGYKRVRKGDAHLTLALTHVSTISIATDASHRSFWFYKGGLYYEPDCKPYYSPSHGMAAVGYGSSSHGAFYIIKNSWGSSWGQGGYAFMARNKGSHCRIADYASFPV